VIAKVARRGLNQDILLPGEVTEERPPADTGVRNHVIDLGRRESVDAKTRDCGLIDAVALLEATSLSRRGRHPSRSVVGCISDKRLVDELSSV
jgi:hypothetical protein